MSYLLHAIAATPLAEPPPGPRGVPLEFVRSGALGAWVSACEGADARDDALEHHRVVVSICDRQPCLPIRFGTRAADRDAARALLDGRTAELERTLERIGSRREIALTLLWRDPEQGRAAPPTGADRSSGRAYLELRRRQAGAARERLDRAERLAGLLEGRLAAERADVRHVLCPTDSVALSTAILAPAGAGERTKERVLEIAVALPGVRALVNGPWPPYTFAVIHEHGHADR